MVQNEMSQNAARALSSKCAVRFSLLIFGLWFFSAFASAQNAQVWDFGAATDAAKNRDFAVAYAAPGGVAARVSIEAKNDALRFTNRAGGSFGLKLNVAPFDANRFPTLDFTYTRSPDTRINFFLRVNGSYYGVIFCGPPRVRPGSFLLGTVPKVGAAGRVVLPLRDWLRRFEPLAEKLQVEEILVGNWDNEGYLLAGIGGNGPGATWSLTKFAILPASDAPPLFQTPSFDGNRLSWPLSSGDLNTPTAILEVDGRKFGFDSPFLRLQTDLGGDNSISRRVILEAGDAGLTFQNGQKIDVRLAGAQNRLTWEMASHRAAPPLPRLEWENPPPLGLDFETDTRGLEAASAVLQLDGQHFASGQSSLQLFNPRTASAFDAGFRPAAIDAARFPFLTFAYRNDSRLRLDFRLRWEDKEYFIRFTDRDGAKIKLGEIANTPDEEWHHAVIPLLDWMKIARPDATSFLIDDLRLSDDAWLGNARGVRWNLDDFHAAPLLTDALKARVTLRDVSGVKAVSYSFDRNPHSDVDSSPDTSARLDIPLTGSEAGLYFLHLRVQNGAGNWSKVAHFPFALR